tara:strand:+ start:21 stop:3236 length:3216 start_codon:yes stop_codon:yes gene_type:complete
MSGKPPSQQLNDLLKLYLDNVTNRNEKEGSLEMEIRFGTQRNAKKITRIECNNVVRRLVSLGFTSSQSEHSLRCQTEYFDGTGNVLSNVRTKINGLGNVTQFCRTDRIVEAEGGTPVAVFEEKYRFRDENGPVPYVDFQDFNFRAALQVEKQLGRESNLVRNILRDWDDSEKIFRFMNRTTFENSDYPFKVDISIVKSSPSRRGAKRFKDSGVMEAPEHYEIEIEVDNEKIGEGTAYTNAETLGQALRSVIKMILSGLQSTNYPVAISEQQSVLNEYKSILFPNDRNNYVTSRHFAGPSSYTLQMDNVLKTSEHTTSANIRNDYTVTDKADGERKLLFITSSGKLYLIDTNMNVQFTGTVTKKDELFGSLIDGEHIQYDKNSNYINLYAAFDIYYIKKTDYRDLPFYKISSKEDNEEKQEFRFDLLAGVIKKIQPASVVKGEMSSLRIQCKNFVAKTKSKIFEACGAILKRVDEGMFEYNTDGLIFTPCSLGVGANNKGEKLGEPRKFAWKHSFKWKPPEYNTIDFMVKLERKSDGQEIIGNQHKGGMNVSQPGQLAQYKKAILHVGYDETKDGYMNPFQDVIDGKIPEQGNRGNAGDYKAARFYPTSPYAPEAAQCNLWLSEGANGKKVILTEEGEVIEDKMVVEFSYDGSKEIGWRWKPLRVRYDKTADVKGGARFGNAYHVANSNWHSIHNPVTKDIITTGKGIPKNSGDEDVYYDRKKGTKTTVALRNYHNWLKNMLITKISRRGDTLIDLAVGKGGDISKWTTANLKFVFGIDYSRDNIENRLDGACRRYLDALKRYNNVPKALFVHGNSSVNIRDTEGIIGDKGKEVTRAVFGEGPNDKQLIGAGVHDVYGIGGDGFDICSIQFAIHYMFESPATLYNFLRNVAETTKLGGYFIGTSYDGQRIFDKLSGIKNGDSATIMDRNNENKMWQVTKQYDRDEFRSDSSSLGYAIDVYQESINKTFREYLVNYDYLSGLLKNYGFEQLSREELKGKELPNETDFKYVYETSYMEKQSNKKGKSNRKMEMDEGEKEISFLNRFFVYKKVRKVDAEKITANMLEGEYISEEE